MTELQGNGRSVGWQSLPAVRRVYIIYNPSAGWHQRRRWRKVLTHLHDLGLVTTVAVTKARGDAEALARSLEPGQYDVLAVAGGDGTINEAINGLSDRSIPLAIIPLGTANVLAAEIGLKGDPRHIAQTIAFGERRSLYLGRANDRCFALMIGVGFDARVIGSLNPRLKRALGKVAYLVSAAKCLLRDSPSLYDLKIGGTRFRSSSVVIGKSHYYGGRFVISAGARIDEPRFHVAIFENGGRWNTLRYMIAVLLGRVSKLPDVKFSKTTKIQMDGPTGEPVHADGDLITTLPVCVEIVEHPLFLIIPAKI